MGVFVFILIIIVVVFFISRSNTTSATSSSSATTNTGRVRIYTDETTKKAFVMYILGSVENSGFIFHSHFENEDGYYWAKNFIENAFSAITTGNCVYYSPKGKFSVYEGQELTPENKVYMDLFEMLMFGDNETKYNRAEDMPNDILNQIRISLHTLHRILTSDDAETRAEKEQLAPLYDEQFHQEPIIRSSSSSNSNLSRMSAELSRLERKCDSSLWKKVSNEVMRQTQKDFGKVCEMITARGASPEEYIRGMVYNLCSDRAESGQYHIYRGVLNPEGEEYLKLTRFALKECVAAGDCKQEWADEQLRIIMNNIQRAG